jgi:hypothetical protein
VAVAEISAEAVVGAGGIGPAEGEAIGHVRADNGEGAPVASTVRKGEEMGNEGLPQNAKLQASAPIRI